LPIYRFSTGSAAANTSDADYSGSTGVGGAGRSRCLRLHLPNGGVSCRIRGGIPNVIIVRPSGRNPHALLFGPRIDRGGIGLPGISSRPGTNHEISDGPKPMPRDPHGDHGEVLVGPRQDRRITPGGNLGETGMLDNPALVLGGEGSSIRTPLEYLGIPGHPEGGRPGVVLGTEVEDEVSCSDSCWEIESGSNPKGCPDIRQVDRCHGGIVEWVGGEGPRGGATGGGRRGVA
jgi:hypothetical protein